MEFASIIRFASMILGAVLLLGIFSMVRRRVHAAFYLIFHDIIVHQRILHSQQNKM
jgi:hypothetical protein